MCTLSVRMQCRQLMYRIRVKHNYCISRATKEFRSACISIDMKVIVSGNMPARQNLSHLKPFTRDQKHPIVKDTCLPVPSCTFCCGFFPLAIRLSIGAAGYIHCKPYSREQSNDVGDSTALVTTTQLHCALTTGGWGSAEFAK
ncbi:hypothetical protein FKM82_011285 [Ascaphus truei]